jgi:hypothetical protein
MSGARGDQYGIFARVLPEAYPSAALFSKSAMVYNQLNEKLNFVAIVSWPARSQSSRGDMGR